RCVICAPWGACAPGMARPQPTWMCLRRSPRRAYHAAPAHRRRRTFMNNAGLDRAQYRASGEPLVADAMRLRGVLTLAALQVLRVIRIVALEVYDLAVAFEREDVRRDPVEEPAIVRDHDGAAREV